MSSSVKQKAASKVGVTKKACKPSPASKHNFFERMPHEILIKILSYLDASALFTMSHVNRLFYQVASDNGLWIKKYISEFARRKKPSCSDDAGHWKWIFFKSVAERDTKRWKQLLRRISCHTGLPHKTHEVLRNLGITWELTVTDKSGHQSVLVQNWSRYFETSLTLCWSKDQLPGYEQISTLQLHGVKSNVLNCPGYRKRSLISKLDFESLTTEPKFIGRDKLVELKQVQPGVIIGVWREQPSIAFFMFTVHCHKLVERTLYGSAVRPYEIAVPKPPFDELDPEYGLHGFKLHIVLHTIECELMSESFSELFCPKAEIRDGQIKLTAISWKNLSEHSQLAGRVKLPWRSEVLHGVVPHCCMMTLTLLDEYKQPFMCVSSTVAFELEQTPICFDYHGNYYLINHVEPSLRVKMLFVCTHQHKRYTLIDLSLYLTVSAINEHFSKNYQSN